MAQETSLARRRSITTFGGIANGALMPKSKKPGETYRPLIRPIYDSLTDAWELGVPVFLERYHKLPVEVAHLYAAYWCQAEVCNGGFCQFFSNPTGLLAPEALEAFRAIGLREWAEILEEAMSFFGEKYPRERGKREKVLEKHVEKYGDADPFAKLDDRFYKWLHAKPDRWELAADKYAMGKR
jgi:hypothetical protein